MAEIVIVSALLVVALACVRVTARRLRAADAADPAARARFAAAFAGEGIEPALVAHAYDALRRRRNELPGELTEHTDLYRELRLTRLDVEDIALLAVARAHGRLPGGEELDAIDVEVRTAGELVRHLARFCAVRRPRLRVVG
jgi:hypothetical protein